MKQVLLDLKTGEIITKEVPVPSLRPGGIIVENNYSVISSGTELSTIKLASSSYIGKAKMRPELFKQVIDAARKQGPLTAYQAVKGRLNKPEPLGYSCAGTITEVAEGVNFNVGDRVACGGNLYAHHSDFIFVPSNLAVRVPDNVSLRDAAYTTLGSIAMQGVRNSDAKIGETVVVIGLGLIGLITIQLLKAAGCKVFGIDIDETKIQAGKKCGMDAGSMRSHPSVEEQVLSFTDGYGADSVIITASTTSPDPLDFAGQITRKKGKVVLVGVVGMEIPRENYYFKELQFIVSCSYGPGRYDNEYEELGHDYPIGYVRWTERRNMEAFLELLSQRKIDMEKISTHEFKISEASKAYDLVKEKSNNEYIGVVLKYADKKKLTKKISIRKDSKVVKGDIGIGMVGAGSYATSLLLPLLNDMKGLRKVGLSAASGISSQSAAETYGFEYATTDYRKLLTDKKIDAIIIATRNSLHAPIVKEAILNGKHVFVEKPLALTIEELDSIISAHEEKPEVIVQVGFNRRYSPFAKNLSKLFKDRQGPMIIMYRINADRIPENHWVYEDREGGSRFVTELCHFIDFCKYITKSEIISHHTQLVDHKSLNRKKSLENLVMDLKFKDGSISSIIYNTISDPKVSKEYIEIFSENLLVEITDFREMKVSKNGKTKTHKERLKVDKGHHNEMLEFIENIKKGVNPFEEWIDTTRITLMR